MISIIISSYRTEYFVDVTNNIKETIGVPYEIIKVFNPGIMGICEAYNKGAVLAKFIYLCFIHEDVLIKTRNWGSILTEKFQDDTNIGLIGIAGSKYKSLSPGRGWFNDEVELDRFNLIQHDIGKIEYQNQIEEDYVEVACLDGVFLFTKKNIWNDNRFDEVVFKDFHCYDIDFSLTINKCFKVLVTNEILLEHFSPGSLNKKWLLDSIKLAKKWKKHLPAGSINKELQYELEWANKMWFLSEMAKYNFPLNQLLDVFLGFGFFRFFSLRKSLRAIKILTKTFTKN